jgi:hypothetical protein
LAFKKSKQPTQSGGIEMMDEMSTNQFSVIHIPGSVGRYVIYFCIELER